MAGDSDLDEFRQIDELEELRRALADTQRKLGARDSKTAATVAAVERAAREAYLARPPIVMPRPATDRRRRRAEVALWHLTDWQGGKQTVSYDLAVMQSRVESFCDKAQRITEIQRADHPVKAASVIFGGDMIEGTTIFAHQPWEVEAPLYEQLFAVADAIEYAVRRALTIYEHVDVVAEWGNHGRIGRKGDSVKPSDNMDRILYGIVAERFGPEKAAGRLTWLCTSRWFQPVVIGQYRAMLIHGDEIKGFGGQTPAYALVRKGNAWASGAVDFDFRDIYVGHYHNHNDYSLAAGGMVFMTGSTESDNEFAREFVAAASVPSQRLHFIDPDKGRVTAEYRIFLDA